MILQLSKVTAQKSEPYQVVAVPVQPARPVFQSITIPVQPARPVFQSVTIPVQPARPVYQSVTIPVQPARPETIRPGVAPSPTLSPAVVVQPTPVPTIVPTLPAQPAGLYLHGQYIPVEPAAMSPEVLTGTVYGRRQVPLHAAGHHTDTPAFGEKGNVILVGHSIWYGELKVFAPVLSLDSGDTITGVNADGSQYTYQVTTRRNADYNDGSWLTRPADNRRLLTLYTCNLRLTGLVVVQAELVP